VVAISTGNSRRTVPELMDSGAMTAVAPMISAILVMLEPIALPIASPELPCREATADTSISGAEVPKPTIVRPMSSGDTPRLRAVAAAPMTKRSAPQTRSANPAMTAAN